MYDFIFTVPHGVIAAVSGVVGYLRTGREEFGVLLGLGLVLVVIAITSVKRFFSGKNSPYNVLAAMAIGAYLVYFTNNLYKEVPIFQAGSMRYVSGFMILFYIWNLFFGPAPLDPPPPYRPPKKTE